MATGLGFGFSGAVTLTLGILVEVGLTIVSVSFGQKATLLLSRSSLRLTGRDD